MTIDIFDPHKSDRTQRLYEAIKPYIKRYSAILDVGCGKAPLLDLILTDFPEVTYLGFDNNGKVMLEQSAMKRPSKRADLHFRRVHYEHGDAYKFIKRRYDVIIHIGVDSWQFSPIFRIHGDILTDRDMHPDYALLEAGFHETYRLPWESYSRVQNSYLIGGYKYEAQGQFNFDVEGHRLNQRHWCVMGRGNRNEINGNNHSKDSTS